MTRRNAPPAPPARQVFVAPGTPVVPAAVTDAVPAEVETEEEAVLPEYAVIVVAVEGQPTADGRIVDPLALTWRDLPLSLTVNHDPSQVAGLIDAMGRVPSIEGLTLDTFDSQVGEAGGYVVARVKFDLGYDAAGTLVNDDAVGREAARMVHGGFLLGVSMEVGDEELEWECIATEEDPDTGEAWCVEYLMHLMAGRIGAVTVCPFQALEGARVIDVSDPGEPAAEDLAPMLEAVAASALAAGPSWWSAPSPWARPAALVARASAPVSFDLESFAPPAEWFEDPGLEGPTPLTITADGRMFGHIATWGTCHIGRTDICLTPPHSATDYAYFRTGEVVTADGSRVPVGVLSMNTGHASLDASPSETVAHYDHTGTQAAHLAAGEDVHGIWVAGALAPGNLTPEAVSVLMAAAPSGDWRRIGSNLELVGVLAVNVPGFPVPRPRTLTAGGQQLALVAAAAPVPGHDCGCGGGARAAAGDLEARLRNVEAVVAALNLDGQAADALAASLAPAPR